MNKHSGFVYQIIRRKFLVIVTLIFVFAFGLYSYFNVPRQEYPSVKAYMAMVTVVYPGLSALDIEEMVTEDVEEIIAEAPDVDTYSSQVFTGGSVTSIMYAEAADAEQVSDSIQELRVKLEEYENGDMPKDVAEFRFEELNWESAGMIVAFSSDSANMTELYSRAESLKEQVKDMSGVLRADVEGKIEEQIEITVDASKLNYTPLNMSALEGIISSQNSLLPIGSVEYASDKISFNSSGAFNGIDEIGDIIVHASESGSVIRLRDIAEIKTTAKDDLPRYYYNGKDAVLVSLYFEEGINSVEKGKAVRNIIQSFAAGLPDTVQADLILDQPSDVGVSVDEFSVNLIASIIIVLVVIMVGMSFRNGIIVSAVIPFTIFAAFIYMNVTKMNIEFVSLAALIIALGMLVDNAIVVSDAIQVRIDNGEDRLSACINGVREIALPVLSSTLTTVAIYTMFFALPGMMANFLNGLPVIVIVTLMTSYVASVTLTPLMCFLFTKKSKPKKAEKAGRLRVVFDHFSRRVLKMPWLVLPVVTVLVGVSLYFLSGMDLYLLPNSEKAILDIEITSSSMHDMRKTEDAVKTVEAFVRDMPETVNYLSSVGRRVPKYDFGVMLATDSVNTGSLMLFVDVSASERFAGKAELTEYLQGELQSAVAGSRVKVAELNVVPVMSEPVQVKISGTDIEQLNVSASFIEQKLERIEGVETTHVNRMLESQEYYMELDNTRLNSIGLTKLEVQNELNLAVMGREVSIYRRNSEEYPVKLKSNITGSSDMGTFMIAPSFGGIKYPVSQFADFSLTNSYDTIHRSEGKRTITVSASAKTGYSPDDIQKTLRETLAAEEFTGMELIYEGESDQLNEIYSDLTIGLIIAVVSIIVILFLQFNSVKQILIILSSIPFCFIGSTAGLVIMKQNLSFLTMLGILSLLGVVVNNAIVLIDYINEERKNGVATREACQNAVARRLRPILLSTVTTVLGLLPLVITRDVLFEGMAIAFMSGLTVSTLFTLVVVPMLYAISYKDR